MLLELSGGKKGVNTYQWFCPVHPYCSSTASVSRESLSYPFRTLQRTSRQKIGSPGLEILHSSRLRQYLHVLLPSQCLPHRCFPLCSLVHALQGPAVAFFRICHEKRSRVKWFPKPFWITPVRPRTVRML